MAQHKVQLLDYLVNLKPRAVDLDLLLTLKVHKVGYSVVVNRITIIQEVLCSDIAIKSITIQVHYLDLDLVNRLQQEAFSVLILPLYLVAILIIM